MIAGIDEAGRGPVIGPLVVAAFQCREGEVGDLESLGVRDSKKLSPRRREELFDVLVEGYAAEVVKLSPRELDACLMGGGSLNRLEGERFGELVNRLEAGTVYIDCADVDPENFRAHISRVLERDCRLVIAHRADERYPVVSAASIIAKVERDRELESLREEYGGQRVYIGQEDHGVP
ncbi:MAG: ribonuclease HII [Euryarchaeota archaeon]|nr:ribonuclease HII [Euryarchaeota archaeon]